MLLSRSILLAYLVVALGGVFCIEQPRSSRLVFYPRWEDFCAVAGLDIYWTAWWGRHYGSLTPNLVCQTAQFCFQLCMHYKLKWGSSFLFRFCWTRKRHIAWCNSRRISLLDRGRLLKEQRDSCIVKSTVKKKRQMVLYHTAATDFSRAHSPTQ